MSKLTDTLHEVRRLERQLDEERAKTQTILESAMTDLVHIFRQGLWSGFITSLVEIAGYTPQAAEGEVRKYRDGVDPEMIANIAYRIITDQIPTNRVVKVGP